MPMEPGRRSDSGYHIRGTVVANITEYVGVFFLENLPIYSLTEISNKNSKRMCHRATTFIYFRR